MNRRITGLLMAVVAVGTSVIVLLRSEKPRRFLQARFEQVRGVLPGPEQVRRSTQHLTTRVSHLASAPFVKYDNKRVGDTGDDPWADVPRPRGWPAGLVAWSPHEWPVRSLWGLQSSGQRGHR